MIRSLEVVALNDLSRACDQVDHIVKDRETIIRLSRSLQQEAARRRLLVRCGTVFVSAFTVVSFWSVYLFLRDPNWVNLFVCPGVICLFYALCLVLFREVSGEQ